MPRAGRLRQQDASDLLALYSAHAHMLAESRRERAQIQQDLEGRQDAESEEHDLRVSLFFLGRAWGSMFSLGYYHH